MKNRQSLIIALLLPALCVGCAAPERRNEISPSLREEQERVLADQWAREIQGILRTREDTVLEQKISEFSARLGLLIRPQITFFEGGSAMKLPPVFALPGHRWYFSSRALKGLKYDNELAAAIAAAHALGERMRKDSVPVAVGSSPGKVALSIPVYSEADWRAVNARMVELLYQAGFDPRGVPQFWKKAASAWVGMSPDWGVLLQEDAHALISQRVPLVNPVVRTPEFGEIEKRLKQL
jgi:hypothetical protein